MVSAVAVNVSNVRLSSESSNCCLSPTTILKLKLRSRSVSNQKLWTASSSLFFAATTMATIGQFLGYGNIVPVTKYGRIVCVIFALIGAPLTLITIGDLGKFLSECTIYLYNKIKKVLRMSKRHFCKFKLRTGDSSKCKQTKIFNENEKEPCNWDDLALDKIEVPVILVFIILLVSFHSPS
ncbi:unnamed protein product [Thelazia callipaeda]|uniref:Ion_trans_2 domain-containing protein n=1 Tax=Thelazia callipaeda TaxID=103827 RepID=A0A0N5CVE6_THECL|nr:unnamed protein product [Thelazia callipaeda]